MCEKFSIFLSLKFYVKSFFAECKSFWKIDASHLYNFSASINAEIHESSKFRTSKCVKITVFGPLKSQNWLHGKYEWQGISEISLLWEIYFHTFMTKISCKQHFYYRQKLISRIVFSLSTFSLFSEFIIINFFFIFLFR